MKLFSDGHQIFQLRIALNNNTIADGEAGAGDEVFMRFFENNPYVVEMSDTIAYGVEVLKVAVRQHCRPRSYEAFEAGEGNRSADIFTQEQCG